MTDKPNQARTTSPRQQMRHRLHGKSKDGAVQIDIVLRKNQRRPDFQDIVVHAAGADQDAIVAHCIDDVRCARGRPFDQPLPVAGKKA